VTTTIEPEHELMRRLLPLSIPSLALAAIAGALAGGAGTSASAAIGVVAVAANLLVTGLSLGWAARTSPILLMAVGIGGFVVRLATFTVALLVLDRLEWFSPIAFAAAFVPATIAVLVAEMRLVGGRMQADLWYFQEHA
jgi:hypothetical protein